MIVPDIETPEMFVERIVELAKDRYGDGRKETEKFREGGREE